MNAFISFQRVLLSFTFLGLTHCKDTSTIPKEREKSKEKLVQTIAKFNKAFKDGNVGLLESMITENYLHTNGSAKAIGKHDWLAYLLKREQEIASGDLKVIEYTMDDLHIAFYGETAIVTGKVMVTNKKEGITHTNAYRVTHIWVDENRNWKRAGFHDGRIKGPN